MELIRYIIVFYFIGSLIFYDGLWACNLTLVFFVYALYKNSPISLGVGLCVIALPQVHFYIL